MTDTFLAVLVLIVGVPIVLCFVYLFSYRQRVALAAGWALAQWIAAERWRAPGVTVLVGLVACTATGFEENACARCHQ